MIRVIAVYKKYKIYAKPIDRLKEWITFGTRQFHKEFWALKNINLNIKEGSVFGIIGPNGAGKSTLLKIMTGITKPTLGKVEIDGRIASLLELGTGFHPEFTGRQNIVLNGKMLGLSDTEIQEKMEEIIEFAELGDFIDQPIRIYSSGMYIRLGFAIASCINPDVFIIDEALSVGDAYFQQKCIKRMRQFRENGVTIIFVSHDLGVVKALCDEVALLDEGEVIDVDKPENVLEHYNAIIAKKATTTLYISTKKSTVDEKAIAPMYRFGNFQAVITSVKLLDEKGREIKAITAGQKTQVSATVLFLGEITDPTFGILIRDRLGNDVFGTNTYYLGLKLGQFKYGDNLEINFLLEMNLGAGDYTLTVATHTLDMHTYECYDWADRILSFKVLPSADFRFVGVAKFLPQVTYKKETKTQKEIEDFVAYFFSDTPTSLEMSPSCQKFLRQGWYQPEKWDHTYMRWTNKEFSFLLKTVGENLNISMVCNKPELEKKPISGTITAFEENIGTFVIHNSSVNTISWRLPERLRNKVVLFKVILDSTWCPDVYFKNNDKRNLGIAVNKIWMS